MKSKAKTKHVNNDGDDVSSCHGIVQPGPRASVDGVRRSTRKRSAPKIFEVTSKKPIGYWTTTEKESLMKVLEELNSGQLGKTALYCSDRYPYKLIRKRVQTKTLEEVKRFLTMLERRGAGMALSQMKHQRPLESWCQMADKLTVLTSDNCSRHLIRVCSVMALESKEEKASRGKDGEVSEEINTPATPATTSVLAPPTPTSPSTTATGRTAARADSSAGETALSTTTGTGPTATPTVSNSTAEMATVTSTNGHTVWDGWTPTSVSSTAAGAEGSAAGTAAKTTEKTADQPLNPNYAAIYKYIGSLMQGECKRLGPLESLVALDCLGLVEEHLLGRNNKEQKEFAQERFTDLIEKLYLSIDCEDAENGVKDGPGSVKQEVRNDKAVGVVTLADLIGAKKHQSQASRKGGALPANSESENSVTTETAAESARCPQGETSDQSEVEFVSGSQSASTSAPISQSNGTPTSSMLQGQLGPAPSPKRLRVVPVGLGSLNPFNIPTRLLDIRLDK